MKVTTLQPINAKVLFNNQSGANNDKATIAYVRFPALRTGRLYASAWSCDWFVAMFQFEHWDWQDAIIWF